MGGRGSGSGFRAGGNNPQSAAAESNAPTNARARLIYDIYGRIGNNPSKVKYERTKSLARGDDVFFDDDQLGRNIEYVTGRNRSDIQSFRFMSIPDNDGYADVEVTFQNPTQRQYTGGVDMGSGRRTFRTTGGGVTRQTIRVQIMRSN